MEKNNFQAAFDLGREAHIIETEIEGVKHVLVPPGCNLESMEDLLPAPTRIRSKCIFSDLESFKAYTEQFKNDDSVIYLNEESRTFTTIFDHHGKDSPAWGDHQATLKLFLSSEWQRFKQADGSLMSGKEFAEFIEDNLDYLSADNMSAADLLTMAQTFNVRFKGELDVDERLHNGLRKLVIKDESRVTGNAANGTEMEFPETMRLKMRFFRNGSDYEAKVYLRYRVVSNEKLVFFIKIPDPEGMEEGALAEFTEEVKEATQMDILKGVFIN